MLFRDFSAPVRFSEIAMTSGALRKLEDVTCELATVAGSESLVMVLKSASEGADFGCDIVASVSFALELAVEAETEAAVEIKDSPSVADLIP